MREIWIIGFPDDRGLVAARGQVPVDAVGRDVEFAVFIPVDADIAGGKAGILDLGIGGDPVKPLPVLAPERIRILDRGRVHGIIFRRIDMGMGDEIG